MAVTRPPELGVCSARALGSDPDCAATDGVKPSAPGASLLTRATSAEALLELLPTKKTTMAATMSTPLMTTRSVGDFHHGVACCGAGGGPAGGPGGA